MSRFDYAYTVPFPKDSKLTMEQVFKALLVKCRDPTKFIAAFTSCEVLEETPSFIKRRVTTVDGSVDTEDIDLYAPTLAIFRGHHGESIVTNVVSEAETGGLLLTFTFRIPDLTRLANGPEEARSKLQMAVRGSMKAILGMFERGELN